MVGCGKLHPIGEHYVVECHVTMLINTGVWTVRNELGQSFCWTLFKRTLWCKHRKSVGFEESWLLLFKFSSIIWSVVRPGQHGGLIWSEEKEKKKKNPARSESVQNVPRGSWGCGGDVRFAEEPMIKDRGERKFQLLSTSHSWWNNDGCSGRPLFFLFFFIN